MGRAVWRKPKGWICCESEEGCKPQPLFPRSISTAQLSTHPGLTLGQSQCGSSDGALSAPPPSPVQSPCGTAPSLEVVTPRGTLGLSPHSSCGPVTPTLLRGHLPLSHRFADARVPAVSAASRGMVVPPLCRVSPTSQGCGLAGVSPTPTTPCQRLVSGVATSQTSRWQSLWKAAQSGWGTALRETPWERGHTSHQLC